MYKISHTHLGLVLEIIQAYFSKLLQDPDKEPHPVASLHETESELRSKNWGRKPALPITVAHAVSGFASYLS